MRQQSPLMTQQSPPEQFQAQKSNPTPQPQVQQNVQQMNQNNVIRNNAIVGTNGAAPGQINGVPIANSNITMERFNQIRQKLTEVQRRVQLLEQTKKQEMLLQSKFNRLIKK